MSTNEAFTKGCQPGLPTDEKANFLLANEYMDFKEFLQDELGIEQAKELMEKFYKQQDA